MKGFTKKFLGLPGITLLAVLVAFLVTGCETTQTPQSGASGAAVPAAGGSTAAAANKAINPDVLRPNDLVTVVFSGVSAAPARHEERIKEDGSLTLPLNLRVQAADKTVGQLQREIYNLYVPKYFREQLTVTVAPENRFFFVDGDVRNPNRYVYAGEMTVMKAIAAAGGFTDFADKKKVKLNRANNGEKLVVDCVKAVKNPALDKPVFPGDQIVVPRRFF